MRRVVSACVLIIAISANAFATWSVVAVDRKTGEIAIASATCVSQRAFSRFPAKGLKDVQAIIIPGLGVAAAQANVDRTRRMHALIADQMRSGTDPSRIVEMLKAEDPNHPTRQYGIVDLKGRYAGYSGASNGKQSLDRQGKVEGTEIYFSIQGNILASDDVIEEAVEAFRKTKGRLADRVMAAMEAADARGGDRRCNCNTQPDPPAPCNNKTSHVAYIVVARKTDRPGEGINNGVYHLDIQVTDEDIKADEDDNPVKTLRLRYDRWRKAGGRPR
jgi:uncharacterized Ntn-hydrolase superfamily protein